VAADPRSALVLFSGGQDSTVCLAHALERYAHVETIGFDYGQRHLVELESRLHVRAQLLEKFVHWGAKLGQDHVVDLSLLSQLSDTALTSAREIEMNAGGLPNTFVPVRNLLFFTVAASVADRRGLSVLIGGMCETDYSGYPDCRDDTINAVQVALNLGMQHRFVLHTPLMRRDKAETWRLAEEIGGAPLVQAIVEHTHSCYLGDRAQRHAWGFGCGACPACDLRRRGWEAYRGEAHG
jgi:7-cyano-7-deazaguanine synthase